MKHLISQFNLQTKLFNNVTAGISDAESIKLMSENANHVAWLTGHLVSTRYMLAGVLGLKETEPFPELFAQGKGMDKNAKYPGMANLTKDWASVSEKVAKALSSVTEENLNAKAPFPLPTGDTMGDFFSFLMHHEAYTIGQVGIYRRFLGKEAMSYK